jgi:hypothetical protein
MTGFMGFVVKNVELFQVFLRILGFLFLIPIPTSPHPLIIHHYPIVSTLTESLSNQLKRKKLAAWPEGRINQRLNTASTNEFCRLLVHTTYNSGLCS